MKILFTTLFLLILISGYAQPSSIPAPTTEEEYNYLTKGYRVQIESGLDMKKGYTFIDMGEVKQGLYTFQFKNLLRVEKNELAGMLVITKSEVSGKSYYICIPINNAELLSRYYNDINVWDESLTTAYCYVISAYLASVTSAAFELEKARK